MCFGGKKDNSAAEAEAARQAEAARLAQMRQAEEARILKETLDNKRSQASREAANSEARAAFQVKAKTALENPEEAVKKKPLLTNYAA